MFRWHNMHNVLILWEYTARLEKKSLFAVSLMFSDKAIIYIQNKVLGEFLHQVKTQRCLSVQVTFIFRIDKKIVILLNQVIRSIFLCLKCLVELYFCSLFKTSALYGSSYTPMKKYHNYVVKWGIWLMQSILLNFSEINSLVEEVLVLEEVSFIILPSSVWASNIFSHNH